MIIITIVIIIVIIIIIYGDLKFFGRLGLASPPAPHNNLSLAVQLEIQAPKDANRKFKKQNKCKISKFYFQLLTHTHTKKTEFLYTIDTFLI